MMGLKTKAVGIFGDSGDSGDSILAALDGFAGTVPSGRKRPQPTDRLIVTDERVLLMPRRKASEVMGALTLCEIENVDRRPAAGAERIRLRTGAEVIEFRTTEKPSIIDDFLDRLEAQRAHCTAKILPLRATDIVHETGTQEAPTEKTEQLAREEAER